MADNADGMPLGDENAVRRKPYAICQLKSNLGTERIVSLVPSGESTWIVMSLPRKCICGMIPFSSMSLRSFHLATCSLFGSPALM